VLLGHVATLAYAQTHIQVSHDTPSERRSRMGRGRPHLVLVRTCRLRGPLRPQLSRGAPPPRRIATSTAAGGGIARASSNVLLEGLAAPACRRPLERIMPRDLLLSPLLREVRHVVRAWTQRTSTATKSRHRLRDLLRMGLDVSRHDAVLQADFAFLRRQRKEASKANGPRPIRRFKAPLAVVVVMGLPDKAVQVALNEYRRLRPTLRLAARALLRAGRREQGRCGGAHHRRAGARHARTNEAIVSRTWPLRPHFRGRAAARGLRVVDYRRCRTQLRYLSVRPAGEIIARKPPLISLYTPSK
jgi:hypothetical protein